MKYRIKDPDVIRGFKVLGWTYEFEEADVERFGFYWHGDCRDKIYLSLFEELEVEPVPELAESEHARFKEIMALVDFLCDATCLAGALSESSDFGKAERRKFRVLERRLSETWFALFERYYKEIDEEGSEDEVQN